MDKLFIAMTGSHAEYIGRVHPTSPARTTALGMAVTIVMALWFMTGFNISTHIFSQTTGVSILTGFSCAAFAWIVERLIIVTPTNIRLAAARIFLSVLLPLLGSLGIDAVLFKPEIDYQRRVQAEERFLIGFDQKITAQEDAAKIMKSEWLEKEKQATCELAVGCMTGRAGRGPNTDKLTAQAQDRHTMYSKALSALVEMKTKRTETLENIWHSDIALKDGGIINHVQALVAYTKTDIYALYIWLGITAALIAFEMIVLGVKSSFRQTIQDRLQDMRDDVHLREAERFREDLQAPHHEARALIQSYLGHAPRSPSSLTQ